MDNAGPIRPECSDEERAMSAGQASENTFLTAPIGRLFAKNALPMAVIQGSDQGGASGSQQSGGLF